MSSWGSFKFRKKCYNCQEELGEACTSCNFIKNSENKTEELKCLSCKPNYHLSPNGYCIHYQSYYPMIPHCSIGIYNVIINNSIYNTSNLGNNSYYNNDNEVINSTIIYNESFNSWIYNNTYEDNSSSYNFTIKATCQECKNGYYKTKEGKCSKIDIEEFSYFSILETGEYSKYFSCRNLCQNKDYSLIYYYLDDILVNLKDNNSYSYNDYNYSSNITTEDSYQNEFIFNYF